MLSTYLQINNGESLFINVFNWAILFKLLQTKNIKIGMTLFSVSKIEYTDKWQTFRHTDSKFYLKIVNYLKSLQNSI